MLDCSRFLDGYSDFRDGLLDPAREESFRRHLARCSSCARYDRVIGGGVDVLLGHDEIEPTEDFEFRLRCRLEDLEREMARPSGSVGTAAAVTLSVALAVALAAWLPALRRSPSPVLLQPVAAHAPRHPQIVPPPFQARPLLAGRAFASYPLVRH